MTVYLPTWIEMFGLAATSGIGFLVGYLVCTVLGLLTMDSTPGTYLLMLRWPVGLLGLAAGFWFGMQLI